VSDYITPEVAAQAEEMLKHPRRCREYPGGIRVYPVDGEFVVADDAGWLPGTFDTPEQAVESAMKAACGEEPVS
jgi:hypothetical protein